MKIKKLLGIVLSLVMLIVSLSGCTPTQTISPTETTNFFISLFLDPDNANGERFGYTKEQIEKIKSSSFEQIKLRFQTLFDFLKQNFDVDVSDEELNKFCTEFFETLRKCPVEITESPENEDVIKVNIKINPIDFSEVGKLTSEKILEKLKNGVISQNEVGEEFKNILLQVLKNIQPLDVQNSLDCDFTVQKLEVNAQKFKVWVPIDFLEFYSKLISMFTTVVS